MGAQRRVTKIVAALLELRHEDHSWNAEEPPGRVAVRGGGDMDWVVRPDDSTWRFVGKNSFLIEKWGKFMYDLKW